MIKTLLAHWTIAVASGFLLCTLASAAQSPAPVSNLTVPDTVSEDHVAWRRDPFIGSIKKNAGSAPFKGVPSKIGSGVPAPEPDFRLQGIMLVDRNFHALINGRSVKAGDKISGVTIKHIKRHQVVVLTDHNETIIYDIYQGRLDRGKK